MTTGNAYGGKAYPKNPHIGFDVGKVEQMVMRGGGTASGGI